MARIVIFLLISFHSLPLYSQYPMEPYHPYLYQNELYPSYKSDISLDEIIKYQIINNDTSLSKKYFYSEGNLIRSISFFNNIAYIDGEFKYNNRNLLINHIVNYKNEFGIDTAKTIYQIIYDEYNNPIYEREWDSLFIHPENGFPYNSKGQEFKSYVYEDGLIIYTTHLSDWGFTTNLQRTKYEYNRFKKVQKLYNKYNIDTLYVLSDEFLYDGFQKLSQINHYDKEGNIYSYIKYNYDAFDRLVEKISFFNTPDFSFDTYQKDIIKYNYSENQLLDFVHIREPNKFTNFYKLLYK